MEYSNNYSQYLSNETFDSFADVVVQQQNSLSSTTVFNSLVVLFLALCLQKTKTLNWNLFQNGGKLKGDTKVLPRKVNEIPRHSNYRIPFINLPIAIEGLTTVFELRRRGVQVLEEWAKKWGPIFTMGIVLDKVTVVIHPPLVQKILGSNDNRVLNKPPSLYGLVLVEWMRNGLFASDIKIWRPHRKILSRTFHYSVIPTYIKMINKHARNLVADLVSKSNENGSIDSVVMYDLVYFHAINIISEIVFGENTTSDQESQEFHEHFKSWKDLVVHRALHPHNLLSLVWKLNPKKRKYDYHQKELQKFIMKGIEKCKSQAARQKDDAKDGNTFISLIQEMISANASDNEIYDEVGTFITAGHETTVLSMQLFMQHIAENSMAQRKCQEELDTLLQSKPLCFNEKSDCAITMDDLPNLKYLERCILETLRITSVGPFIFRQLSDDMDIDDFKFKKDTIFCIPFWAIHKDPNVYENPSSFDPDNFTPENMQKRHPYSNLPFSQGPRGCIGMKFAMAQMKVLLGFLLHNFDFHTADRLNDVKMMFGVTLMPERDYNITLKLRKAT